MSFKTFLLLIVIFSLASCSYFTSDKLINGTAAPEISLPDKNGNIVTLSSLKGKIVLVEFWGSWCKPCRKQNPFIVDLYNKYKDTRFKDADGFTVFSVALESDKENWLAAIAKDSLPWEYHVSDLKMWKSEVLKTYNINSIPASFLIDQNGIIIGKDLHHRDLDKLLAQLKKYTTCIA